MASLVTPLLASAQDADAPGTVAPRSAAAEPIISRIETIVKEGGIPQIDELRLPPDGALTMEDDFLAMSPLLAGDVVTTDVIFADVADSEPYARMALPDLVAVALRNNFDLINSRRSVQIARSSELSALANFIPFVDLFADARIAESRRDNILRATRQGTTTQDTTVDSQEAGIEMRQNFTSGGALTFTGVERRVGTRIDSGNGTSSGSEYIGDAGVNFVQPLLRGGGFEVGTADLRSARLSEANQEISDMLTRREVVLSVVREYFGILQTKQALEVSRDAIRERYNFLEETRIKYETGRVAESEILRAEIQFLQEVEQAINRQQALADARERLLILVGLPLETPISLIDVTPMLRDRGRFEIPGTREAVAMALNNRMELIQADIGIAQSEISQTLARNDRLPRLDFDASFGRSDNDDTFRDANQFDDQDWDAGLTFRVPLQNIQRREAHRRATLRLEQDLTNRLELERRLTREALTATRDVLSTEANLTILRKTVEQARRSLELINASFKAGFSTITEVRLTQDDLFQAETRYNNALLNYQVAVAELYVALGLALE
ncbi:MAG: TolC family protein [Sumerlaeia bacterium]